MHAGKIIQCFFSGAIPLELRSRRIQCASGPRTAANNSFAWNVPSQFSLLGTGPGQVLPMLVQLKMESFFGTGFSDVRIHVGSQPASIGAVAFTTGSRIFFSPGQYNPNTVHGQRLLGHELAHVVQQRANRVSAPAGHGMIVIHDRALEAEADRMGAQVAAMRSPLQVNQHGQGNVSPAGMQRKSVGPNGRVVQRLELMNGVVVSSFNNAPITAAQGVLTVGSTTDVILGGHAICILEYMKADKKHILKSLI